MALVLGTNCGFVTTAPTADPNAGFTTVIDNYARVTRFTSPATATKITEMGWWCDTASEESNFEVGLYAADGEVVPGEAGTLLEVSRTNAKGTTAGWKTITGLNWEISGNTNYWFGVQLDNIATTTYLGYSRTTSEGIDLMTASTLPNPYGGGSFYTDGYDAIYAVWEEAPPTPPPAVKKKPVGGAYNPPRFKKEELEEIDPRPEETVKLGIMLANKKRGVFL